MAPPLFERLQPCGPVVDPGAADRVRRQLLKSVPMETNPGPFLQAWPALAPMVAASPYLAGLTLQAPARLAQILAQSPDARLAAILAQTQALGALARNRDESRRGLRRLKADLHLLTAVCDLGGIWDLGEVTGALTQFADASLRAALSLAARDEAAAGRLAASAAGVNVPGLFFLALGKHGAGELNYSSDIDVSVFFNPDVLPVMAGIEPQVAAVRLTQDVVDLLQTRTEDGYVFRVDLRLRPDPASTPVALPMEAAFDYYQTVGQNWERAAMIKARAVAGDLECGEAFLTALMPFVWRRHLDFAAIADIHAMKRQIHVHKVDERLTAPGANLKLGAGGIREIEFFVQTLQLIYGGRDARLRSRRTLDALAALTMIGAVSLAVKSELTAAYERLRGLEHRVQMINDEQTHVLSERTSERQRVAAISGYRRLSAFDAAVSAILSTVNRRYGELFAEDEPLSSEFGSLVFTGVEDDPETLMTLGRMGFSHPPQVSALIRGWHHGRIAATRSERGRELFTRLAPRLLEAVSATGVADVAFNRFADFFSALRFGVQVQSLFIAEPDLFRLIVEVMAYAPRLASTLARQPAALDALLDADFLGPLGDGEIEAAVASGLSRATAEGGFEAALDEARRVHREVTFRIGVRVITGAAIGATTAADFTRLADALIDALATASLKETERVAGVFDGPCAVVALGKAGSGEMTASSDLDLMTVYADASADTTSDRKGWGAETFFARFTQRLVAALAAPTAEGELYRVDLQLRPSGMAGPVAVSMSAFEHYYASDAETWEHLALTRARVVWSSNEPFAARSRQAIQDALRRPRARARVAKDVRDMRALMRHERPGFGPWDLKLIDGGLVDIEFAAQYLQIIYAAGGGPLAVNTQDALNALTTVSAAPAAELATLLEAWTLQQNLSQVLKIALADPCDPDGEPARFKTILSNRGGAPDFDALKVKLRSLQRAAHAAYERIVSLEPSRP